MAKKPESILTTRLLAALRQAGWWTVKLHGGPTQQAGLPDILAIREGHACFVEVKLPGGRPTPLQQHMLQILQGHGATCLVATCLEDLSCLLDGPRPT